MLLQAADYTGWCSHDAKNKATWLLLMFAAQGGERKVSICQGSVAVEVGSRLTRESRRCSRYVARSSQLGTSTVS